MSYYRPETEEDIRARFEAKIDKSAGEDGCWPWLASTNGKSGYGIFRGGKGRDKYGSKKWILAHRYAYELEYGDIPDGLQIDHLCKNRLCVNPRHMEAVSQRINTLRSDGPSAKQARQTHCIHGHPFDILNTRIEKGGKRRCLACTRERDKKRYIKRKTKND